MRAPAGPVVAALLVLSVTACSGGRGADPVDLGAAADGPSTTAPAPSGTTTASGDPSVPTGGGALPTVGLPTEAEASLRGAAEVPRAVRRSWTVYQEALSESLRAHRPTAELRATAGPEIVQMVQERGPTDARDGLTVSLRPLGRLESFEASDDVARLRTCLWAPSVGFFVEADGRAAEGADPGWVEYRTVLEQDGGGWTVTRDARTGKSCTGGAP